MKIRVLLLIAVLQNEREVRKLKDRLVQKLKNHDEKSFEIIMEQYARLVASVINNIAKGSLSKEDIEETVADVFVTLWNNAEKVQNGKLKGYICCIAKTRALNKLSACAKRTVLNIDDYDLEDNFSIQDETEKKDINNELREIIRGFGQTEQEIIIRYYYYNQTTSKISEIMNLNYETVKSKLRRTREKIKTILIERGYVI